MNDIMMLKNGGNDRYHKKDGRMRDPSLSSGKFTDLESKFLQLMQDAEGNFHLSSGQNEEIL